MSVAVIVVIAVFFLGMGVYALAAPAALIRPFGVALESPVARSEVRAVRGELAACVAPDAERATMAKNPPKYRHQCTQ